MAPLASAQAPPTMTGSGLPETRLLRKAHGIYNMRADRKNSFLKNISFNFAGSISLRLLTFDQDPTLSPFNVCTDFVLQDLAVSEARRYPARGDEMVRMLDDWMATLPGHKCSTGCLLYYLHTPIERVTLCI